MNNSNNSPIQQEPLAIVAGVRTPFVKVYGAIAKVNADILGKTVAVEAIKRAGLEPKEIDETIFGNVSGQYDAANVARVIALRAGIPNENIGHTVNRNCASGMEAVIAAWQIAWDRKREILLAGGTESMSNIPFIYNQEATEWFLKSARAKTFFQKVGHFFKFRPRFVSPIPAIKLGLTDPVCGLNMGETAENIAEEFAISREEQDQFALNSHQKTIAAQERNFFQDEIVEINTEQTGGKAVSEDVGPRKGQSIESLAKLRPIFRPKEGTVTVGNSCPITDGAVALIVMPARVAKERNLTPLGYLKGYTIAGCDPSKMGLGPVYATNLLLNQTGLSLSDFDLIEINEAFAAQVLGCIKAMESADFCKRELNRDTPLGTLDMEKLNVNGGAIALGHPVGATGARLILTLLRALREKNLKRGLATLCVGGGQGVAMWLDTELD